MESDQTFEDYLISKKIDGDKFKNGDGKLYTDLKAIFDQMHPKSFTQQKLFLINPLRGKYLLSGDVGTSSTEKTKVAFKPKTRK